MSVRSRSNWNMEVLVFKERGKPEYLERNLSVQRERTNNKLNPHMASNPGIEHGPHWWEASALTTALSSLHLYHSLLKHVLQSVRLWTLLLLEVRNQ